LDTITAFRGQLKNIHDQTEQVLTDLAPEALNMVQPGATIGAISGIYAHMVFAEDRQINMLIQGKPTILESQGWGQKLGVELPQGRMDLEWRSNFRADLGGFMDYARAVYATTDSYLAGLSESDLEREFEAFGRQQKVGPFLANVLITHLPIHLGEIAALKGVQGLQGLP
jgi:hypothetical protein